MTQRTLILAALLMAIGSPVFAAEPAPATPTPATPAAKTAVVPKDAAVDEKREGKMRDRWRKMTPEQRDEMRQKAERRLQERFERLSTNEQTQINAIMADMDKLTKEQRSVLMARVNQKNYKDRQQRKLMEDMEKQKPSAEKAAEKNDEAKADAAKPDASVVTPTAPAAPTAPTAPVVPEAKPAETKPGAAP